MSALFALLLAALPGAVQAERDFAAMAQAEGQWTAFRAYADEDAVMFVPEPVNAQQWLAGRADPPFSVMWWPAKSFVSCDGGTVVNTGAWVRPGRGTGFFTTVWRRQPDGGWKWSLDHGGELATPRPTGEQPTVRRAACPEMPLGEPRIAPPEDAVDFDYRMSDDATLRWSWMVRADGSRRFEALLYTGDGFEPVVSDEIGAGE